MKQDITIGSRRNGQLGRKVLSVCWHARILFGRGGMITSLIIQKLWETLFQTSRSGDPRLFGRDQTDLSRFMSDIIPEYVVLNGWKGIGFCLFDRVCSIFLFLFN